MRISQTCKQQYLQQCCLHSGHLSESHSVWKYSSLSSPPPSSSPSGSSWTSSQRLSTFFSSPSRHGPSHFPFLLKASKPKSMIWNKICWYRKHFLYQKIFLTNLPNKIKTSSHVVSTEVSVKFKTELIAISQFRSRLLNSLQVVSRNFTPCSRQVLFFHHYSYKIFPSFLCQPLDAVLTRSWSMAPIM